MARGELEAVARRVLADLLGGNGALGAAAATAPPPAETAHARGTRLRSGTHSFTQAAAAPSGPPAPRVPAPAPAQAGGSGGRSATPVDRPVALALLADLLAAADRRDKIVLHDLFGPAVAAGVHRLGFRLDLPDGRSLDFLDWYTAVYRTIPFPAGWTCPITGWQSPG